MKVVWFGVLYESWTSDSTYKETKDCKEYQFLIGRKQK